MTRPGKSGTNMMLTRQWEFVHSAINGDCMALLNRRESYGELKGSRRVRASG